MTLAKKLKGREDEICFLPTFKLRELWPQKTDLLDVIVLLG